MGNVHRSEDKWAVYYFYDRPYGDPMPVTYHKRVNGQMRQLTVSPKLLRKMGVCCAPDPVPDEEQ